MPARLRNALILSVVLVAAAAAAEDAALPATTHDGLVLSQGKVARVLYVRPGVDFSQYKRIAILDCAVAFRKDWERDQTASGRRISQKDMDRIKSDLSAEFLKVFVDELQNKGGYQIVSSGADDVLVLRPAIVDLDVTAPDTMEPGRNYTLTESAGAMTLYIEFFDSVTGQILARAIDREASRGMGRIQWSNRVTNKQEADRILRRWASALRTQLDAVHGRGTGSPG
jgi:hypothetical protein